MASTAAPSAKVTVPAGVGTDAGPVTVAVRVTDWPTAEKATGLAASATADGAGSTTRVTGVLDAAVTSPVPA